MLPTMTPQEFVTKWRPNALKESAASKEHFLDVCALLGHETPAAADPTGSRYTFEKGATKATGGEGYADVWKGGYFAWEYKGPHGDLEKAYGQLLKYRESLENPPLLVVSDMAQIVIHTNYTNTVKRVETLALDDLLVPERLEILRDVFFEPYALKLAQTPADATQEAARKFARIADILRKYGEEPPAVAHYLICLLFCLFAEDIGLLPGRTFSELVRGTRRDPKAFRAQVQRLFGEMATGGWFGAAQIPHIDGSLFDGAVALELDTDGMAILDEACALDWSSIDPSILGTLFERSLDPDKRSQLGAHYTSREDITLIVEPVLMAPLRRRWQEVQAEARAAVDATDASTPRKRKGAARSLGAVLAGFAGELARVQVLDPACGSGNFLYVALREMLGLWKEVANYGFRHGLPVMLPLEGLSPWPGQMHGLEVNPYAHALAQATVWIGYLQWLRENGYGYGKEPILRPLETVRLIDAVLAHDAEGRPAEPEWPKVDVIVGNPPFVGGGKIRAELGDEYADALFRLYGDRLPNFSDLVCYWFEKARAMLETGKARRAGLLATQAIRGGASRTVLKRISATGAIFWAWADRDWVLDGATVHVSMVGFDDGSDASRTLNGATVERINSDLTSAADLTAAARLSENTRICFMGASPKAPFDIEAPVAEQMLSMPVNVNGRPNSDVVRPVFSGVDLTQRSRGMWTIDFGLMNLGEAAQYEAPFEYATQRVYPIRSKNRRPAYAQRWWQYAEARPGMRAALAGLGRFVATPELAKHRVFLWVDRSVLCNQQTLVFAREDDYFIGVLQARPHTLWALRLGTQLREKESGNRYTPTTTFETYPFPWPPGQEPAGDARVEAIAEAARRLVAGRDAWLNPPDASAAELKERTLTNLYNARPTWLRLAHEALDRAVLAAYGWPEGLGDEEVLERLLALNGERRGG